MSEYTQLVKEIAKYEDIWQVLEKKRGLEDQVVRVAQAVSDGIQER